jgi:hypothetical protein
MALSLFMTGLADITHIAAVCGEEALFICVEPTAPRFYSDQDPL